VPAPCKSLRKVNQKIKFLAPSQKWRATNPKFEIDTKAEPSMRLFLLPNRDMIFPTVGLTIAKLTEYEQNIAPTSD